MVTAAMSIAGYVLERPFSNAGGGQSEWTFAQKNGTSYFIKRFLKPTYPVDGGPGSPATKARKRTQCERFEAHHRTVQRLLNPLSGTGGNLVVTRDFFRHEARYFKVTDRVDSSRLPLDEIARLPVGDQISLMLAVGSSVHLLHRNALVHGDLKPDNVLVRHSTGHVFATKLIDFDNCFQAGAPPEPDELVGDPTYYSPELMSFMNGAGPASAIGQASDVFALALVFAQYLTGQLPSADRGGYLADNLLRGDEMTLAAVTADREPVRELIGAMTAVDPAGRPTVTTVIEKLKEARRRAKGLPVGSPVGSGVGTSRAPGGGPGLRGKGIRTGSSTDTTSTPTLRGTGLGPPKSEKPVTSAPKLKGKLLDQARKKAEGC
ncbi:serine/threonine protein kinase [Streptomyces sp. NPDC086549]|uniref:serine/threonine protein kinase n=1 Tax=Streptomyces sp. NPDC086549 TaxID=3365752 RepID=UPI0037F5CA50